ncbi:hypothetical protein M072_3849 [Bacteroides fragilis str. DS-208]|nr:hypothetical protein M072_3849 [Bacteroides fragilis str. DS-208]
MQIERIALYFSIKILFFSIYYLCKQLIIKYNYSLNSYGKRQIYLRLVNFDMTSWHSICFCNKK